MKYFQYGVRSLSVDVFSQVFNEGKDARVSVMDEITRLGIQGWENYSVIKTGEVLNFFFRKEVPEEKAREIYMDKETETYPLGFVDHPNLTNNI
jgi:hypothetical protein